MAERLDCNADTNHDNDTRGYVRSGNRLLNRLSLLMDATETSDLFPVATDREHLLASVFGQIPEFADPKKKDALLQTQEEPLSAEEGCWRISATQGLNCCSVSQSAALKLVTVNCTSTASPSFRFSNATDLCSH